MAKKTPSSPTPKVKKNSSPITLAVDIGGTGVKMMLLDKAGKGLCDRLRSPTPEPATPGRILELLDQMRSQLETFDRVSVGFPGVIKHGCTMTAHNLSPEWEGFCLQEALEKRWKHPVRVANDAAVQGYGAIEGKGVELVLTLGTGLGSSLFTDGHLCPGLELAHHPWRKGKTYEDYLGRCGLKKAGKKRWNKLVQKAIGQIEKLFNYDSLYIGGGNASLLDFKLPENTKIIPNQDGLIGGYALWRFTPESQ